MDSFEIIVAGAVLAVMLLLSVVLVYVILILRMVRAFLAKMRKGEAFVERIGEVVAEKVATFTSRQRE